MTWFVYDGQQDFEFVQSKEEALKLAEEYISRCREEAVSDGEWGSEVEDIVIGTITHEVKLRPCPSPYEEDEEGVTYADAELVEKEVD